MLKTSVAGDSRKLEKELNLPVRYMQGGRHEVFSFILPVKKIIISFQIISEEFLCVMIHTFRMYLSFI